jgi:hypothetical protein
MRKIVIIGGGQSGLRLVLGLLQNKYEVIQPGAGGGRVLRVPIATNDPITGQGANTASRAASIYLQRILEHGGNGVSC